VKDIPRGALIIAVHDGDSVTADVDYPFAPGKRVVETEKLRLAGIQAAELKGPLPDKAIAARDFLASQILNRRVSVQKSSDDKFGGRVDAAILLDGVEINQLMISSGHAVAWDGRGPKPLGAAI
jgi:endonuclease YncB( thermonuclease family)